jgi:SlyX protein
MAQTNRKIEIQMNERVEALEVQITHLSRVVEDLSDICAQQADEIGRLKRRLDHWVEREAQRQNEAADPAMIDQRPPHY